MTRRLWILLLTIFLLFAAPSSATMDEIQSRATNPYFGFKPASGGPGTVVHLTGGHYWGNPVEIYMHAPKYTVASSRNEDWNEACDLNSAPSGPPITTAQSDLNGNWSATFTIPSILPSGQPITKGAVCIEAPSGVRSSVPFIITSDALPRAGQGIGQTFSGLLLMGLALVLLGFTLLNSIGGRTWSRDRDGA